jgi:ABC-type Na+ efflux pump permease subunit
MIVFLGDCDKSDFVISVAVLMQASLKQQVTIITDKPRTYRYFDGEVSGIKIAPSSEDKEGIILYDCYQAIVPEELAEEKIVLVTTLDRANIEETREYSQALKPDALVVIQSDCSISSKYIETHFQEIQKIYYYQDDPRRRIDLSYQQALNVKKLNSEFVNTVNSFASEVSGVPSKDLKQLWAYLKKRG